jgi:intraflagellar transport protein 80
MRFKIQKQDKNKHSDLVACVGWSNNNELFSVSDDMTMNKWDINGEPVSNFQSYNKLPSKIYLIMKCWRVQEKDSIMEVEQPVMTMDWLAAAKGQNELLAIGCSDGSFRLVGKSGRVEKSVSEAH